ncbi:MAG: hypothetical protein ABIC95_04930 [archaeon]
MNEVVRKDILAIISQLLPLLEKGKAQTPEIRTLSNRTIHNASIFQDQDSVSIAVVTYALSKIIDRQGHIDARILKALRRAYNYLLDKDVGRYERRIKDLLRFIAEQDKNLKSYITQVIEQAQVKKGSKIYDHGISMARTSEILGISQWELSSYVGSTTINDMDDEGVPIAKRMKFARSLFPRGGSS